MKLEIAKKYFPEYKQVLQEAGGYNPRKFVQEMRVVVTPATFNPSAQGDFAFTHSFDWDGKTLRKGPAYSYDTMMPSRVSPYERAVSVPAGHRIWVTTYDGQWGGFWAHVIIYVNANELPARCAELLALPQVPKELPPKKAPELVSPTPIAIPKRETPTTQSPWFYSIDELKGMCREKGLPTEGSKESLIRRLFKRR